MIKKTASLLLLKTIYKVGRIDANTEKLFNNPESIFPVFCFCYCFVSHYTAFSPLKMLSSAVERLKTCDDAFRKQLEQERQAHEQQILTLTNEKQREIEQANSRVRHDKLYTSNVL